MTVPVPDSVVVAVADEIGDPRLQFADVIVLRTQPTAAAAARLAETMLCHLPGCVLVGAGVATGGCLLCSRGLDCLVVGNEVLPMSVVMRLAARYHAVVTSTITSRRDVPGVPSGRRRPDFPDRRRARGPW